MRLRVTTVVLVFLVMSWQMIFAAPAPPPPISAEACYMMVLGTQRPLYQKNGDAIMYPASTTKIMTALVALEKGDLDSVVTISQQAANVEGSSLDLKAGEQLTLHNLLTGMMAVSGNDAAEAVAEHIGGSRAGFADLMNQEAVRLGTSHTHFSNPHGLPDPVNHYTTAHDLALIAACAMKQPEFRTLVSHPWVTVHFLSPAFDKTVHNTNKLLGTYPDATGVKTGSTNAAGDCLVASAKRDGVELLVVILNDDERWQDAANLLDYGFEVMKTK